MKKAHPWLWVGFEVAKKEQRPGGGHPGPLSEGRVNRFFSLTYVTLFIVAAHLINTQNRQKLRTSDNFRSDGKSDSGSEATVEMASSAPAGMECGLVISLDLY